MARFGVYNHRLVLNDGTIYNRKFIVLKDDHIYRFTDLHRYCMPRNKIRRLQSDGNNRFDFIVQMLNFLYFERGIPCLEKVRIKDISDFMSAYGMGKLPDDPEEDGGRAKGTVQVCLSAVMDFWKSFIEDKKNHCSFKESDLYKNVPYRDKNGATKYKKVPAFDIYFIEKKKEIFRDIPNDCFDIMFRHITLHHPEILGLVMLSAFAGLRPSEACNVRRTDSPYGAGIQFQFFNGKVDSIKIDLKKELVLRSDLVITGSIKKERTQRVPDLFISEFCQAYNTYMDYLDGRKYEAAYGPLNINRDGKAITYDAYYKTFRRIIREELIPIYLKNENPEVVAYGLLLQENNISPHVFRHWYTVQLVLSGVDNPRDLAYWRGDSSEQSAFTYLQNKGELAKQYHKVANESFEYMQWAAMKQEKGDII